MESNKIGPGFRSVQRSQQRAPQAYNPQNQPQYSQPSQSHTHYEDHYHYQPQSQPQYANDRQRIYPRTQQDKSLITAAFIVMLIITIFFGLNTFGIAFAWCIPMTIYTYGILTGKNPNTVVFGVCGIIFTFVIPGVLLLVANKDK